MEIEVIRKYPKETYTIGILKINGRYFCDTLEDPIRPTGVKVYGETAIPAGSYTVIINYSPKFKRDLPMILDVPGFTGVRIHAGNTAKDTEGCILVGINNVKGKVTSSRATEDTLLNIMKRARANGETFTLTIRNKGEKL